MKKIILLLLALWMSPFFLFAADEKNNDKVRELVLAENGKACMDIVIPDNACYVTTFASDELKKFLKKSTGADFQVVIESKHKGENGIFLGNTNALQRRTGIKDFEQEQYLVKVDKDAVFIAGKDVASTSWINLMQLQFYTQDKGTLFGVYAFLEKFCGIRFFAPGEIGEFIPKCASLTAKESNLLEKPYFAERLFGNFWYGTFSKMPDASIYCKTPDDIALWALRLRLSAKGPASGCHTEQFFKLKEAFSKTHPEYFALQPDGTRNFQYLCWSSPAVIELWQKLADAYFSGKSPSDVGLPLKEWIGQPYKSEFMIDPMDCYEKYLCQCPDCRKFAAGRGELGAGELVFAAINKIAAKIALKYPDKYITTLVYPPKQIFPKDSAIPKNLLVRICIVGPDQESFTVPYSQSLELLRQWNGATGKKIPLWIYLCNAVFARVLPGPVETCPHAFSRFLQDVKPYSSGMFVEIYALTHTTRNMDIYIQSRLLFDPALNVDTLLDEYFNKFYGPAAGPAKKFFARLELNWRRILDAVAAKGKPGVLIGLGDLHTNREYWQKFTWKNIYDEKEMLVLDNLLKDAEKCVAASQEKIYKERVALLRDYIFKFMQHERNIARPSGRPPQVQVKTAPAAENSVPDSNWQQLKPLFVVTSLTPPVKGQFNINADKKDIFLNITLEEPLMDKSASDPERKLGDNKVHMDNTVELFFTPENTNKIFQIVINDRGLYYGYGDKAWSIINKITVKVSKSLSTNKII
ncbi:MAG: DUF4838 domain-containing protein [Victivallaceae bacterium]|jgi:hypothetical protein